MGNSLSCNKCSSISDRSVFTFSNDLVYKYTEGRQVSDLNASEQNGDEELFRTLKCIDDSHSEAFGLTPNNVNNLIQRLEKLVQEASGFCPVNAIITCHERNEDCPLKCEEKVTQFKDCVDEKTTEKQRKSTKCCKQCEQMIKDE